MNESENEKISEEVEKSSLGSPLNRKSFLRYVGVSAAAAATFGLVGCNDDEIAGPGPDPDPMGPMTVNLGTGDLGILNYAYALEQLEAAFYIQVMNNPYSGINDNEMQILSDLRDHEVAHRDWFAEAISGVAPDGIIPGLTPNFDSVDFTSRASVLGTAQVLEDTGVSAYNGAGPLISSTDAGTQYLIQAGKIVSVEARHAAAIRSLINPFSADFAGDDVVDQNGLDVQNSPADVLAAAGGFIVETIDASGLPTA